jgi:hypothetical protein
MARKRTLEMAALVGSLQACRAMGAGAIMWRQLGPHGHIMESGGNAVGDGEIAGDGTRESDRIEAWSAV